MSHSLVVWRLRVALTEGGLVDDLQVLVNHAVLTGPAERDGLASRAVGTLNDFEQVQSVHDPCWIVRFHVE